MICIGFTIRTDGVNNVIFSAMGLFTLYRNRDASSVVMRIIDNFIMDNLRGQLITKELLMNIICIFSMGF